MAITIRGTTPATTANTTTPLSVLLNGARQPQNTDRLLIIGANDWGVLADTLTPTIAGSSAGMNLIASADAGASNAHAKAWYYDVGATGDLTVSEEGNPGDSKCLVVYVLTGHAAAAPVGAGGSGSSTSQVAPTVTATGAGMLFCHTSAGAGDQAASYTPPGGMAETYDALLSSFYSYAGANETLASAGATGTRTFTAGAGGARYAALSIAVETPSGPPPEGPANSDAMHMMGPSYY